MEWCDLKRGVIRLDDVRELMQRHNEAVDKVADLQAENASLREENAKIAQSAIDIVTVECERPEHKALNFGEWMEQGGGACSVCMTEKLASAEQRAERAELLVRLMRTGKIVFLIPWLISISHGEMVTFHRFTEPGIPDLTTEQWERLEQLERGGE
jgi:hypothetical protein